MTGKNSHLHHHHHHHKSFKKSRDKKFYNSKNALPKVHGFHFDSDSEDDKIEKNEGGGEIKSQNSLIVSIDKSQIMKTIHDEEFTLNGRQKVSAHGHKMAVKKLKEQSKDWGRIMYRLVHPVRIAVRHEYLMGSDKVELNSKSYYDKLYRAIFAEEMRETLDEHREREEEEKYRLRKLISIGASGKLKIPTDSVHLHQHPIFRTNQIMKRLELLDKYYEGGEIIGFNYKITPIEPFEYDDNGYFFKHLHQTGQIWKPHKDSYGKERVNDVYNNKKKNKNSYTVSISKYEHKEIDFIEPFPAENYKTKNILKQQNKNMEQDDENSMFEEGGNEDEEEEEEEEQKEESALVQVFFNNKDSYSVAEKDNFEEDEEEEGKNEYEEVEFVTSKSNRKVPVMDPAEDLPSDLALPSSTPSTKGFYDEKPSTELIKKKSSAPPSTATASSKQTNSTAPVSKASTTKPREIQRSSSKRGGGGKSNSNMPLVQPRNIQNRESASNFYQSSRAPKSKASFNRKLGDMPGRTDSKVRNSSVMRARKTKSEQIDNDSNSDDDDIKTAPSSRGAAKIDENRILSKKKKTKKSRFSRIVRSHFFDDVDVVNRVLAKINAETNAEDSNRKSRDSEKEKSKTPPEFVEDEDHRELRHKYQIDHSYNLYIHKEPNQKEDEKFFKTLDKEKSLEKYFEKGDQIVDVHRRENEVTDDFVNTKLDIKITGNN